MCAKRKIKEVEEVLNVPVQFGTVSITTTAHVGVKINRENLNIDAADELLCGRHLTGKLLAVPPGEDPAQQLAFDTGDRAEVAACFDVKRFSADPDFISAGLTFALAEIDVKVLSCLAKKSGRLVVTTVADMPDGEEESEHSEQADE
jgi:hypothetical protein